MGTIKAARFHKGHVSFFFQQDRRLTDRIPDIWLSDSQLEECARPADEQVTAINNATKERL
jgi:hypothetical protein